VLIVGGFFLASASFYTLQETEQAIITEFGKPVGQPVTNAGLHFKMPITQEVNVIDKQILEWDAQRSEMPTRDKLYISVGMFARWRITRPLEYFRRLRDERSAQSRLDDILGSETRNAIAKHDLIEVVRTTKDRKPTRDETLAPASEGYCSRFTRDAPQSSTRSGTPPRPSWPSSASSSWTCASSASTTIRAWSRRFTSA
jgi:membrane protease subunit HflC